MDETLSVSATKFNRLVHHVKEIRALTAVVTEEMEELIDELNKKEEAQDAKE